MSAQSLKGHPMYANGEIVTDGRRVGDVIRSERKYRQDGYVIRWYGRQDTEWLPAHRVIRATSNEKTGN